MEKEKRSQDENEVVLQPSEPGVSHSSPLTKAEPQVESPGSISPSNSPSPQASVVASSPAPVPSTALLPAVLPPRKQPSRQGSMVETSGLGMSASRAEEVRRRHEMEVAALGADVLASIKAQQAKDRREKSASVVDSEGKSNPAANPETPKAKQKSWSSSDSKSNQTNTSTPLLRISSAESNASNVTFDRNKKLQSSPLGSPSSEKHAELHPSSIELSRSTSRSRSEKAALARSTFSTSSLATRNSSVSPSRRSDRAYRNPKTVPAPSPYLPIRPDARGLTVVPLPPSQLGRRPDRPVEGRVWTFDVSDDSESTEEEEGDDKSVVRSTSKLSTGEDDDSDSESENEDDLDPEEIAEEERRTEAQKKRATTMAAGQEIIRSGSTSGAAAARKKQERSNSKATTSSENVGNDNSPSLSKSSSLRGSTSIASLPGSGHFKSSTSKSKSPSTLRNTSSLATMKPSSDSKNKKTSVGRGRSATTTATASQDEAFLFDDDELWPSSYVETSLGLGAGKKLSKGAREASIARSRAARDRREEEQRRLQAEKERKRAEDPENLDYGWPRSLQGSSLY